MPGSFVEVAPSRLLRAGVIAAPLACLIGIFAMTAGTDESWIVFGVRGLAEHGQYGAESPYRSVHSTGGAYTAVAAGLHLLGGGRLEVVRLVSVLGLAGLLYLIWRLANHSLGVKSDAPWLMSAALLALPGTFMLGSEAFGEVLATALVVGGACLWGGSPGGAWGRRVWTGLLLGTAAATRLNCIIALAALPLAALLVPGRRRSELTDAGIALIVGAVAFAIQSQLLVRISVDPGMAATTLTTSGFTLEGEHKLSYLIPLTLDYWITAQNFLPFFVIAAVLLGWAWARTQVAAPQGADFLIIFSVLVWGAWLVKAPIPHLRYLWPGLAALAIVGGLVLSVLARRLASSDRPLARAAPAWLAVSLLFTGYVDAARTYENGESDILSWQWQGATARRIEFGPLRALRSQKSIVARLKKIPSDQNIACIGFDTALSLLTRRPIVPVEAYYPGVNHPDLQSAPRASGPKPRWLAITPFVNRFPNGGMTPALHRWIEQNCRMDCRFGPYVLYEVTGTYPESPAVLALHPSTLQLPLVTQP